MRVKKPINNNILCVVDEKGTEMIVTGRGIGFGKKVGEFINPSKVEKTYRMVGKKEQRNLRELIEQIPLEHLEITQELIDTIKKEIPQKLNESLLITLTDHISFAIQRKEQGIEVKNPLRSDIMCYYPAEYRLGLMSLDMIEKKLSVRLNDDEAAFIALHIVNAELNTSMSEMYNITELIEGTISVTEYFYGRKFDRSSLAFSRFVVHLRYFAQRIFQNSVLKDTGDEQDVMFRKLIEKNCKEHYKCAKCIQEYVKNTWHKELSDEELIYLAIHLKRIAQGVEDGERNANAEGGGNNADGSDDDISF